MEKNTNQAEIQLDQIIMAVEQELNACTGKERSICSLRSGKKIRSSVDEGSIYEFTHNLKELDIADEELAIHIAGMSYPVNLIRLGDKQVELECKQDFGKMIPSAVLVLREGAILRALKSKLKSFADEGNDFSKVQNLFSGRRTKICRSGERPSYSCTESSTPNSSQRAAIENSFANSLALIWGPPGAGKTKTIAQAIEAHLNAGRRVLLLSNANAAVDLALKNVADHLKNSYYEKGLLLRLGVPKNSALENSCPMVFPAKIADLRNEKLASEKRKIIEAIQQFEARIQTIASVKSLGDEMHAQDAFLDKVAEKLASIASERKRLVAEHAQLCQTYDLLTDSVPDGASESSRRKQAIVSSVYADIQARVADATLLDQKSMKLFELRAKCLEKIKEISKKRSELLSLCAVEESELESASAQCEKFLKDALKHKRDLDEIKEFNNADAIDSALLLATTLAKVCYLKKTDLKKIDVVIIDEASMAAPAMLFWAATFAEKSVTLVGDFKQLPPVSSAEIEPSRTWFRNSIYDHLKIGSAGSAIECPFLTMLDTQYRMNPAIANICNELCYGERLKNGPHTPTLKFFDELAGDNCLVLIDSSELKPFASPGRINHVEALLAKYVASYLNRSVPLESIGVCTPYRKQAEIVGALCQDIDPDEKLLISTVHKFQGGEKDAMIFSCVESPGVRFETSMLNDKKSDSTAEVLLNVAISRARKKLFLIANLKYLEANAPDDAILKKVISVFKNDGVLLDASKLPWMSAASEYCAPQKVKPESAAARLQSMRFCDEIGFWPAFYQDLDVCSDNLDIVTGFVGKLRSEEIIHRFRDLVSRGVSISLFTRPPSQHGKIPSQSVIDVFDKLRSIGIRIYTQNEAHQKAAIIDGKVAWQGSLNIMSHQGAQEQMIRFANPEDVAALSRCLDLNRFAIWNS